MNRLGIMQKPSSVLASIKRVATVPRLSNPEDATQTLEDVAEWILS